MNDPAAIAERLKDVAYDEEFARLEATIRTGPDTWTTITVGHAGLFDDAPDGWAVTVEEGAL